MDGNLHGNDMQMRLCIAKLGVVSSIYANFWDENLPLTGIYKGIFAQVLAFAWFYKFEKN